MFYIIFFAVSILSASLMYFSKIYKSDNPIVDKTARTTLVVWMCLYFLNLFLPDGLVLRAYENLSYFVGGDFSCFPYA